MAFAANTPFLVLFFLTNLLPFALSDKPFPCFFIFGDSLVDSGNNNNLNTSAKANYPPYGVDFPHGPTGRFTNGLTTADFLAQMLGFDTFIPPFAEAQGGDIINGVNYASASAGILSETGQHLGDRYSLDEQLQNHEITVSRFAELYGNVSSAKQQLNKCFYYLAIGSNDYINNYYKSDYYNTSRLYTPQQYADVLLEQMSQQLKKLYNLGARKIGVAALAPLGCTPAAILTGGTNGPGCYEPMNDAVGLFNQGLNLLMSTLTGTQMMQGLSIYNSLTNNFGSLDSLYNTIYRGGLQRVTCCRVEISKGLCIRRVIPCAFRNAYSFFDSFHPTQKVNQIVAAASYIDILKLA